MVNIQDLFQENNACLKPAHTVFLKVQNNGSVLNNPQAVKKKQKTYQSIISIDRKFKRFIA